MAFIGTIITDPDDLNSAAAWAEGTGNLAGHYFTNEIHLNCVDKTFHFKGGGNLDTSGDGVTGQALYSFFKDRWQDTASITKYDFPMLSITNEQFEFIDSWIPDDGASAGTLTDLTFTATGDTITTAGSVDFTDFFKAGDTLTVTNADNAANDGDYTIDTVTSTVITVSEDALTDDGTGDATATLASNVVTQGAFTTSTSKLIRTAGWAETVGQLVNKRVSGIVTLGTLVDNTDQPYYAQSASTTSDTFNLEYTGPANEGVRIYSHVASTTGEIDFVSTNTISSTGPRLDVFEVGDVITVTTTTNNNTDYTVAAIVSPYEITTEETVTAETPTNADLEINLNSAFSIFVRERTKIYADSNLSDIGVTTMTYIVYRFPVSNANDLNSTVVDTGIDLQTTEATASDFDFTAATTLASTAADLSVFSAGDLIKITGSTSNDGFYLVASGTTNLLTIDTATTPFDAAPYTGFNVETETTSVTVTEAGVSDVSPYDVINVTYLLNPDTGTGDVNITGAWASGTTYSLGDVAFDTGDSKTNGDARWYYLDATTSGGVSAGANMNADSNNTWTLWDKASGGGERWVKDGFYAYNVIIDANNSTTSGDAKADSPYTDAAGNTKEKVYDWAQWALRQDSFIDIGATRNGNVADTLVNFVGATLETADGVFIDDLAPVDTNAVALVDYAGVSHTYPLVVTVTINFNNNLINDDEAVFYAYYDDPDGVVNGNEYGTTGALQVVKSPSGNVGADVTPVANNIQDVFDVAGDTFYRFSYAYDSDETGGRTVSTDTDIVVVAIGLNTGQYVRATGTITDEGATVSLVAPLERNYSNPA